MVSGILFLVKGIIFKTVTIRFCILIGLVCQVRVRVAFVVRVKSG